MGSIVFASILLLGVTACGANLYRSAAEDPQAKEVSAAELTATRVNSNDFERLKELWEKRSENVGGVEDFPIGPGDLLEISVPAMPELASRVERVSGEGKITLPYIGEVEASGMTSEELKAELHERLLEYMHNPRVFLVVKEYHSRQVAVLGSVLEPGMYTLDSASDTLYDLITRAGGVTTDADPVIQIIPAEEALGEDDKREAMAVAAALSKDSEEGPAPLVLKRTEPIVVDTADLAERGLEKYLQLPARPGDVIMVPGGAQVLVEGWVEEPGAYPVTQGLTVAGVIAAAGGPLYPADLEKIRVIRPEKDDTRAVAVVNLEKIKSGETEDVRLKGGDIVEVPGTDGRLVSYGVYKVFDTMVNMNARVPVR